ncbi:MAG: thermonuclease family protein [Alphaproteobacteria bacterium]|nr:thermonuclease family protein [Alphaproteobacteria bacterium]
MLIALLLVPMTTVQAESLIGKPVIIDGDSVVVEGKRVRVWGIDAPEMGTRAGSRSKSYLRTLIGRNEIRCEDNGQRIQGQIMAQCFIGGVDIGRVMVLSGNAVEWRRYSQGFYAQ